MAGREVKPRLLNWLVCPVDGQALTVRESRGPGEEIEQGALGCGAAHSYPIRGGIPRLLPPGSPRPEVEQTRESFSAKWKRIPDYGHEVGSRRFSVAWFLERYGFADLERLRTFLAGRRFVLDAGTGLGRDASLYAESSDAEVFALDFSDSVDLARRHVGHLPNVHLIQADLTALPFRKRFFDFLACDQALHHTPDTRAAFEHLAKHVAPGGELAVYVYRQKAPLRELADDYLRGRYTRASEQECYAFSRAVTRLGRALAGLKAEVDIPEDIPALGIAAGRHDVQRLVYWHMLKCFWNDDFDFETNVMVNFDWYRPVYAHRHRPEEIEAWCAESGLEIVHLDIADSGISVRAALPIVVDG